MGKRSATLDNIITFLIIFAIICAVRVYALFAGMGIIGIPFLDDLLQPVANWLKHLDVNYYLEGLVRFFKSF